MIVIFHQTTVCSTSYVEVIHSQCCMIDPTCHVTSCYDFCDGGKGLLRPVEETKHKNVNVSRWSARAKNFIRCDFHLVFRNCCTMAWLMDLFDRSMVKRSPSIWKQTFDYIPQTNRESVQSVFKCENA